ncbi:MULTISPECIES: SDR family oxidoreductase [Pandoraea]|uniref:SDR family NAD(P)-dependent oxidoreductase n=1 Tax=Pandoraea TaxID=93217 RepID=UPI001F5DB670|nr:MULTISPECIES: SDR family oxidoreductase [Pandoraea]MCI3208033.1 hypothetical protein [Pandoraea sp. LA3]MDN4586062.1 hypothetical protein [Pandoraea capi]
MQAAGAFAGRVILVTGGSEGIGAGTVEAMAREGGIVHAVSRSPDGERIASRLVAQGLAVSWTQADVAEPAACAALVRDVVDRFGRLDVLVNNAGNRPATLRRDIGSLTDADLHEALATHLHGPFNLSVAAWPHMASQRYGRILNFCSGHVFGSLDDHGLLPFGIAKAGIIGLTKMMATPAARCGIAVNALFPAALDSHWNRVEWRVISEQEEQALADVCSHRDLWPFIRWICGPEACNGEMFSVCNTNLTHVFVGDSENFSYPAYADMSACVGAAMASGDYYRPRSVGQFFSRHLGAARSKRLFQLLTHFAGSGQTSR